MLACLALTQVVLSFPFRAGSFASFVIAERESKAKHLQTVAGVEPSAYWMSTFLWDTRSDYIYARCIFRYRRHSFLFWTCLSRVRILFVVCIFVSKFLQHRPYHLWIHHRNGGPLTVFILLLLSSDPTAPKVNLKHAATILTWILRFLPSFCLGKGLFFAINIETIALLESNVNLSVYLALALA
jgi:ATP-binding cassette subfamily A (ABC1) protein 3